MLKKKAVQRVRWKSQLDVNHLCPVECSIPTLWTDRILNRRDIWLFLLLACFAEIPVFNANNVDPDQTPRFAAFDLGLHCLSMCLLWDARYKRVNGFR